MQIGLISDTHGLMRPEALDALKGVEHIIHAGDIGAPQVLQALEQLAPLTAIRGNNDAVPWARAIPETQTVLLDGLAFHVIHDVKSLCNALPAVQVIVSGHSHKPSITSRDGVLLINPGSAGPRRFKLPISVALLDTADPQATARICLLG